MNKKEIEKLKDPEEYDWNKYFAFINAVCPWSQMYWERQQLEIVEWTGEIFELSDDCVARIYKHPTAKYGELIKLIAKMNGEREKEEWLYSFPGVGPNSAPVGLVIQQDRALLYNLRKSINEHETTVAKKQAQARLRKARKDYKKIKNKKYFNTLRSVKNFNNGEELWIALLEEYKDSPISVLEFGVFEGDSIKYLAKLNSHKESKFFGFDSFKGLPEDFYLNTHPKGTFDLKGVEPKLDDERISFVKGWFQNTLPMFLSENKFTENLIVHYDADIYSATLFVMMELDRLKQPYLAIFDEFIDYESKALYSYCQMMSASVEFFGTTVDKDYPTQVSCKISPQYEYFPYDEITSKVKLT